MAILTKSGRIAIAKAIASRPLHLAWGQGDETWPVDPPPEDTEATALLDEVGRRYALEVAFVVPNEQGEIVVEGSGRYSRSPTPTNNLYLQFKYDFADGATAVIRELGVFVDTELIDGLPPGQEYFVPSEIADGGSGTLLHLEHTTPNYRSPATRESYEVIITF